MTVAIPKRLRIFGEELRRSEPTTDAENPYWQAEENLPHPNPELGCIRRGLCCRSSPGWFGPGEVEAAAALRGQSPQELVESALIIDGLDVDGERVEVFAPVKLGRDGLPLAQPGTRVDRLYRMFRSPCVFFQDEGCTIYDARPIECRRYVCTQREDEQLTHLEVAKLWRG
ncbi:MAG: hypothetical protein AUK47_00640 [Deltaproteobacteria bacterium CG2_30_63_29]|nr:MAG: hypothetical protein AUK47_00640 [Deltaproteobacteria bacterium CG2_30_63_29]PIV98295.1 MAG: hypothetical protein COW42_15505 [Deltaproteobacteria bacterium CG17_big_fil_post_rev_8_21_14_2_50_63_7]PJB39349.1 MAG: hypothetical protein CO108_17365 [Deltaproteobacteria bacterium CG_4_9_14_3_um_filter_63_12]